MSDSHGMNSDYHNKIMILFSIMTPILLKIACTDRCPAHSILKTRDRKMFPTHSIPTVFSITKKQWFYRQSNRQQCS